VSQSPLRRPTQGVLFQVPEHSARVRPEASSNFVSNMALPVHRWFRFSAGFSAAWVESLLLDARRSGEVRVFDPFAGSGTTLLAAERVGVESWGIEAHPVVSRIASSKLAWRSDPDAYLAKMTEISALAKTLKPQLQRYPVLIRRCYDNRALEQLDVLRQAYELCKDKTASSELAWLTLIAILRPVSRAGTAPWQYVLPKKLKRAPRPPLRALEEYCQMFYEDMLVGKNLSGPRARFLQGDARSCDAIPTGRTNLVITSPPYPNNYDYADATRLEMTFMGEIRGWADLQDAVRCYLVRSCSQHVPESEVDLDAALATADLDPIRREIVEVCGKLAEVRKSRGGRKTYHLMVACYFSDLAKVWKALRRVCGSPSRVCFVVGDSAPYGVHVPVIPWLGQIALAAGFRSYKFEKTRDRNVKWKNRKHRVPLVEGRLWVIG